MALEVDDPSEPAGKRLRVAKFGQVAIGLDERLLCGILGQMEIAQN